MSLDHGFKGTWEHKLRQAEIERTAGVRWHENDQQAVDDDPPISHHISHFLPPEEMAKFMQRQKVWIVQTILNTVLPICFKFFQVMMHWDLCRNRFCGIFAVILKFDNGTANLLRLTML